MHFSKRTGWERGHNGWTEARLAAVSPLLDLTRSSPLQCGLGPDVEGLLAPLADAGALDYAPEALGMPAARASVAAYYADHRAQVALEHLCLTTSTSEAYSFLFRLLCDPGDEVLIACPSYPLFELLAQLDDVVLRSYPLRYDPGSVVSETGGWSLDRQALSALITRRTRAVVVVHPNNPTGNFTGHEDRLALQSICAERGLALIVDEVFLDYPIQPLAGASIAESFTRGSSPCLQFVLSGLSKICALPQMKLSWIAASGPRDLLGEAMERLEIVADTFLSLNAPAQFALPYWLNQRAPTQGRIRERLQANLITLDQRLKGSLASRYSVEGGWTAVLRVPSTVQDQEFSLAAMRGGVLVQPGAFYGMSPGRAVVSLLTPPDLWAEGLAKLPID